MALTQFINLATDGARSYTQIIRRYGMTNIMINEPEPPTSLDRDGPSLFANVKSYRMSGRLSPDFGRGSGPVVILVDAVVALPHGQ